MTEVRTRFAPSPTGYLHIGGLRTALYSWLFARKHGGKFILRVEDTDKERNNEAAVEAIYDGMRWGGLDWDEGPDVGGDFGPYRQTERLDLYRDYANKLIASGHAYRCFATTEEREAAKAEFVAKGGKADGFAFQSPWRDRTDGDLSKPHVIRFKTPKEGATSWNDLVRGKIEIPHREIIDFVMVRGDGVALYNFACVIDDLTMKITHVVRGDDHIINTAPQILMYRALGVEPPLFAHLSLILAPNGKKLSKRDAAVGVHEYRESGYLPEALVNYLARLGWSHGDQEIFTMDELRALFDLEHVNASGAKYDLKKLAFVQGEHVRKLSPARLAELSFPFLAPRGLVVNPNDARLVPAFASVQLRTSTLRDAAERVDFYFRAEPELEAASVKKFLVPAVAPHLASFADLLAGADPFEAKPLEELTNAWLAERGIAMKDVAQAVRVALTGRGAAPGLFEIVTVLGQAESVRRIRAAVARAERG